MKKYLVLSAYLLLSLAMAQDPPSKKIDYYMMKNNHVIHFLGTGEVETVMTNATLANGTVISSKGAMVGKKAAKQQLENGECIDVDGTLKPCAMLDSLLTAKLKSKEIK